MHADCIRCQKRVSNTHLSSPWDVTPAVIQVGISQNTERCMSSSDSQPQMRVISPGCPDLGRHPMISNPAKTPDLAHT